MRPGRIPAIDAMRGLTFFVMVFVNELSGVSGMPAWAKHMPAAADVMSFVDVVFPAFLFIVGLSIPFSSRAPGHVAARTLALVVMGFFMVNAEGGHNEAAMVMPVAAWSLLFYLAVVLTWGEFALRSNALKVAGVLLLLLLAALYRGGADGRQTMTPQWWGILGLIGWAYLAACVLHQLSKGRLAWLLVMIAGCIAYYAVSHLDSGAVNPVQRWLLGHDGHAAHTSIVLCGVVCALLFYDAERGPRFGAVALLVLLLVLAGWWLRPYFGISKIRATPSWCLYSAAICTAILALLHWLIELKRRERWMRLVEPAAANPLVTYLLPFVIGAALSLLGWRLPTALSSGAAGVLWAAFYAVVVLWLVSRISRLPFRLRL